MKKNGFTLIEIIVVMAIIAIASAIIIPRLGSNGVTHLKAEVREVAAILNHARQLATIQGQEMEVKLYATPSSVDKKKRKPGEWHSRGAEIHSTSAFAKSNAEKETKTGKNPVYRVLFYPGGGSSGGTFTFKRQNVEIILKVNLITGKVSTKIQE